jgi:hypothetical protein
MYVLRHDHVTSNYKEITQPNALQRIFKKLHRPDRRQVWPTPETAEGEEVKLPGLLITDALAFHTLREYSNRKVWAAWCFHPRSPKARDRGHPQHGLEISLGPAPPADEAAMNGAQFLMW